MATLNLKLMTKIFYDLETTGTDKRKHGIHQISGIVEVDNVIAERFNFNVAPHPKCLIDLQAMAVGNVTEAQVRAYPEMKIIFNKVKKLLEKYCDRFNRQDKIWLCGFNNRSFDDVFFRAWFEHNGDDFFGSWFWTDSLDVLVLSSQYLLDRRKNMPNFKLKTVAKELGFSIDESRLHDSAYDVELTRLIYRVIVGLDIEPKTLM